MVSLGTSVDLSRSFVVGNNRQAADWPGNAVARYELLDQDSDPTTAEAVRVTRAGDGGSAVSGLLTADFSVVEFCCGAQVQHYTATFGTGDSQIDLGLSSNAPADKSFVLLSQSTTAAQPNQDERWAARGELVSNGDTLRLRRSETGASTTVAAQVVVFDPDTEASVQSSTVVVNGNTSVSYQPQSGAGEFLFFSNSASVNAEGVEGKYRVRGSLANGQATFATSVSSSVWVTYYVVSMPGTVVQSGVTAFSAQTAENGAESGVHYTETTLTEVALGLSFAYVTASGGTSTRNDALGDTSFTAELTGPGTLRLERADRTDVPSGGGVVGASSLEAAATAAWFVVQLPFNRAPELEPIEDQSVDEGEELTFTAIASDPDNPPNILTYSLVGGPDGAIIDANTGVFSWTPTEEQGPSQYTFTVRVTDGGCPALSDAEEITISVNEVNRPPVLSPLGNLSTKVGSELTFTAIASDPDLPSNTLSYSLTDAPMGATIDAQTGSFSWTPTVAQGPGRYTISVHVSDDGNPSLFSMAVVTANVNQTFDIPENSAPFTQVGDFVVEGPAPAEGVYEIISGSGQSIFIIDSSTGSIELDEGSELDFESTPIYTLTVRVTDSQDPTFIYEEAVTIVLV